MVDEAGRVARRLRELRQRARTERESLAPLEARVRELDRQRLDLQQQVLRLRRQAHRYAALTRWMFPAGWVTVAAVTGAGLSVLALNGYGVSAGGQVTVAAVVAVAAGVAAGAWLRAARRAGEETERVQRQLETVALALDHFFPTYQAQRNALAQLEAELRQLEQVLGREVAELLTIPWRQLSGRSFEQFLLRVFRAHGYDAELTTAARDQGVDLIVRTPSGRKIAVEAKGYPSGNSVGNDIVLKVLGGARYYGCDRAVVITNSRFTADALQAAQRTGTLLIGAEDMERFIQGAIDLDAELA